MITISGKAETTTIIKKSKFICLVCRVTDESQAREVIASRNKLHYDASHNCFAYILSGGIMRYSDDGEPKGTAGLPMLDVIKKNGLSDVLVVSTRYFGGTLLGAGGLVRAYGKSASSAIGAAQKVQVITCSVFETAFSYNSWSKAQRLLTDAGFIITDTEFSDTVHVCLSALPGEESALEKLVSSVSLGKSVLSPQGIRNIERKI